MQNYNKSRSDWLIKVISFLLIGCCDYFGFGFATLNTKALYSSTVYRLLPINKVLLVIYHFPPKFSVRTAIILSTEPNMARWMMTGLFFSSPSPLNHKNDTTTIQKFNYNTLSMRHYIYSAMLNSLTISYQDFISKLLIKYNLENLS